MKIIYRNRVYKALDNEDICTLLCAFARSKAFVREPPPLVLVPDKCDVGVFWESQGICLFWEGRYYYPEQNKVGSFIRHLLESKEC